MSVLVVKAKVMQWDEDQMELLGRDIIPKEQFAPWVWRMLAIPIEQISSITQFNKTKSLITDNNGYDILVAESFDTLWPKWKDLRKEYYKEIEFNNQEGETISDEDEE